MADDGAHEEPKVRDLLSRRQHFGLAEIKVHLPGGGGNGLHVVVAQAVDLELEGQRRLQMAVDLILVVTVAEAKGEVAREPVFVAHDEHHAPDRLLLEIGSSAFAEVLEAMESAASS